MKVETIKEIGKRMGNQKGKTHNFYNYKKGNPKEGLVQKLILGLIKKEK